MVDYVKKNLLDKINEFESVINQLQRKIKDASDEDKKKFQFEINDLKAKKNLAESELQDKWKDMQD